MRGPTDDAPEPQLPIATLPNRGVTKARPPEYLQKAEPEGLRLRVSLLAQITDLRPSAQKHHYAGKND